jgi:hypothetical protein
VYAYDVNILGGSIHTIIKKKNKRLFVSSKEIGLKDADKTKYMVMSQDQNAE